MPGGPTQERMSRSLSHVAVRLPRFALTAWWIGLNTCNATNTLPVRASGRPSESPCCTAPTSTPMEIANSAGNAPRNSSTTHHTDASPGAAFGSTVKNFHSFRARRRLITSLHRGPGLGERPAVALEILGDVRAVSVLMDRLHDRRAGARRLREVRVEIVDVDPRHVRDGCAFLALALEPEDEQRGVPDMELDPRHVGIVVVRE